ncbi:MAG: DUF2442 domain-containing protein [Desulfococcaceae bacterium]
MNTFVKGVSVKMDEEFLHVKLEDGRIISTPMKWYPELLRADKPQAENFQFICKGTGIEWPELDFHLSVESMLTARPNQEAA